MAEQAARPLPARNGVCACEASRSEQNIRPLVAIVGYSDKCIAASGIGRLTASRFSSDTPVRNLARFIQAYINYHPSILEDGAIPQLHSLISGFPFQHLKFL